MKNGSSKVRKDIFDGNQHLLSISISLVSSLFPAEWKLSDRSSLLDQSEAAMGQSWPIRSKGGEQSLQPSGEKFVIVLGKISFLISAGSQPPPPQIWTQTDLMTTLTTSTNTYTTEEQESKLNRIKISTFYTTKNVLLEKRDPGALGLNLYLITVQSWIIDQRTYVCVRSDSIDMYYLWKWLITELCSNQIDKKLLHIWDKWTDSWLVTAIHSASLIGHVSLLG